MGPWILWTAFALAFTPALAAVAERVGSPDVSVDRAPLVGAGLLAWSIASVREPARPGRRDGAALLLVACLLELVGISGRSWSLAYLALPVGFVGLARYLGRPPLQVAALSFFAVPPPYFVTALGSPELEAAYAAFASALVNALGTSVRATLGTLEGPAGSFDFVPADGGVPLAQLLAGIGWFGRARTGAGIASCAAAALRWGVAAVPLQAAGMVAAAAATGLGAPGLGRLLLRDILWPAAAAGGLLLVLRREPAPAAPARVPL